MRVLLRHRPRLGILVLLALLLAGAWIFRPLVPGRPAEAAPHEARETATPPPVAEPLWTAHHQGVETAFALALDEVVLRDADGGELLARLEPPATRATLAFRLARLAAEGGVFPVAYPVGKARSDETRVLVTPELRVRVDGRDAATVAVRAGLEVTERPDYAPDWVIMRAPDALAALDSVPALRAATAVREADVLLAAKRFLRALPDDPLIGEQWHLKRSGAALAGTDVNIETIWNYPATTGIRGSGVRIGIVDNGVQLNHPDLFANIDSVNGWDWNGNDNNPSPGPGNDHGTACAGLAAARGNNAKGVSGTAPLGTLVPLRLLAAAVTDAQEAAAMAWKEDIIQVKSNSWGPSDSGGVLDGAGPLTRAAIQSSVINGRSGRGSIHVWAAGNGAQSGDNSNNDGYANLPETIAVGATDSLGRRAYYSESGANLVVCAPSKGEAPALAITTTDRTSGDGYHAATSANGGDYYSNFTGTSASAPIVSGIVALILERNPLLGWRDVQEILIRSATKVNPTDPAWQTNSAGIPFHHDFGAGLVNAGAAVNLAATWPLLGARASASLSADPALPIPCNSAVGLTHSFDFSGSRLRLEHVTLKLDVPHPFRGDLEITLSSPAGTVSRLSERQLKGSGGYAGWTFSSVRHWGEHSAGIWTLHIADRGSGSVSVGTLQSATLTLSGSASGAVNPRPDLIILEPSAGRIFSPVEPIMVQVSATDLDLSGKPGEIQRLELIRNGAVEATLLAPPWHFVIAPGVGSHTLLARATDSQGATGTSAAVSITVANLPPQMKSATLSSGPQEFADVSLQVAELLALDPEGDPVTYAYQWQLSNDGVNFSDVEGGNAPVLPAAPGRAGKLWRCQITPSDGTSSGAALATAAVNLVNRPPTTAFWNLPFDYDSGLLIRRGGIESGRQALLHEFSHGSVDGVGQWIEWLSLEPGSLAGWSLSDAAGNSITLSQVEAWIGIPAGTLIVIYDGSLPKDPLLPPDNADPAAGGLVLASTDPLLIAAGPTSWLDLGYGGGSIFLIPPASGPGHSLAYGSGQTAQPNVGPAGAGTAPQFIGDSAYAADLASQWRVADAATCGGPDSHGSGPGVSPGQPNGLANAAFIDALRGGGASPPALFRLGEGSRLPAGLALDPFTGQLSGTPVADAAGGGPYPVTLVRSNALGEAVELRFSLEIRQAGYPEWIAAFPDLASSSPGADPDADGLPNAVEFALGTHPQLPEAHPPITLLADEGGLSLSYRLSNSASQVSLIPEWSATMEEGSWQTEGILLTTVAETPGGPEMRADLPADAAQPRRFMRLRAVLDR
jgi:subtilisin family serine protease